MVLVAGLAVGIGLTSVWAAKRTPGAASRDGDVAGSTGSPIAAAAARPAGPVHSPVPGKRGRRHTLTHPLLRCAGPAASIDEVQGAVRAMIDGAKRSGLLQQATAIYTDFESDQGFAIAGQERYIAASLMKLPVAMSWMKVAQFSPEALRDEFTADNLEPERTELGGGLVAVSNPQFSDRPERLSNGKSYPVIELIGRALINSDNDAALMLSNHLRPEQEAHLFDELAVRNPLLQPSPMSGVEASTFAAMFEALYNATYLGAEASGHLLELLTRSRMKGGIAAGVPKDVKCANKFGVAVNDMLHAGTEYFHDCGIVYAPQKPVLAVRLDAWERRRPAA